MISTPNLARAYTTNRQHRDSTCSIYYYSSDAKQKARVQPNAKRRRAWRQSQQFGRAHWWVMGRRDSERSEFTRSSSQTPKVQSGGVTAPSPAVAVCRLRGNRSRRFQQRLYTKRHRLSSETKVNSENSSVLLGLGNGKRTPPQRIVVYPPPAQVGRRCRTHQAARNTPVSRSRESVLTIL